MKDSIVSLHSTTHHTLTRRQLLKVFLAGGTLAALNTPFPAWPRHTTIQAQTFIGKAGSYQHDLRSIILKGLQELNITSADIKGKRILLKPNLVETHSGHAYINTHPLVVRGAIEAFLHLGAHTVLVGEGPGHRQDVLQILDESGLTPILQEDGIPFVDLNEQSGYRVPNQGQWTSLSHLTFPKVFREVDWIVSMPKMKTHHWAGVTLSMKNLFGVLPGIYYGWPKNVLHQEGIHQSILDITGTLQPDFAIVDGIVGMEGDGPIMGTPKSIGVIVMGRNLPAVDSTCTRLMGIDPYQIPYLNLAEEELGTVNEANIVQRGEPIWGLRQNFALLDHIPAHQGLRLTRSNQ